MGSSCPQVEDLVDTYICPSEQADLMPLTHSRSAWMWQSFLAPLKAGFAGLAVRVGTSILLHRAWLPVTLVFKERSVR